MSEWRSAINRKALARLARALPAIFPPGVLTHALARRFTPPMPRLAVDSYWRAHPLRADRLARALATKTGAPPGWMWRLGGGKTGGIAAQLPAFRRRSIASAATAPSVPASAASVDNRSSTVSAGIWTRGIAAATATPPGMRLAWWPGICGRDPPIMPVCCGACSADAAPQPVHGSGNPPRSIIACRCSGCGASTATNRGRRCFRSGACRTFR